MYMYRHSFLVPYAVEFRFPRIREKPLLSYLQVESCRLGKSLGRKGERCIRLRGRNRCTHSLCYYFCRLLDVVQVEEADLSKGTFDRAPDQE